MATSSLDEITRSQGYRAAERGEPCHTPEPMWRAGWDLYWESGVARNMRFLTSNQTMNGFRRVPGGAADQAMTAALAAMTEAVERLKAGVPPKTPDFIAGTKDTEDTSR